MKKKDLQQQRNKTAEELKKEVDVKTQELSKIRIQALSGKPKNVKAAKNTKRDIAQLLTIIREKQILAESKKSKERSKV
ncbi:unnamed protein product [marine sediment metagenome]|uniref:Ribosomal protein L29 n=1 Tax=marine sediment metagenome TaxID=412755 RepID=X0W794_9ZZZZ